MAGPPRIFSVPFAQVYPCYVAKAEKKGRSQAEVDRIICWLTGYTLRQLQAQLKRGKDCATFLAEAPQPNPARSRVTGVVCGVRVETVEDPTMRELRRLDKLIDELAKGKDMTQILRAPQPR